MGIIAALCAGISAGCGFQSGIDSSRLERTASGETLTIERIEAITGNPDLDAEGRRAALRELGITDEDLLDALIAAGA